MEELIARAKRLIEKGDVTGARKMLAATEEVVARGPITFALAETYDPNRLAAWGARGVVADVEKARALYAKAMRLGEARAQWRLGTLNASSYATAAHPAAEE
jgi:TPR repeat protein